ncbi:efflux transporter outer membrane subunit [soil metagenome]
MAADAASSSAEPAPDLASWWRALGDPALDGLVTQALAGNLPLAAAGERLRASRALLPAADGPFRPNLRFATTSGPSPDSRTSYFQAGFDAQWEFGLFGRAEATTAIAAAEVGLAQADMQSARASLVAEVVRTHLEFRHAERRLALLDEDIALQRRLVALTDTRIRTRQAAGDELVRARVGLAQAEALRTEPLTTMTRCRQQLTVLLGDRHAVLPYATPAGREVAIPVEPSAVPSTPRTALPTRAAAAPPRGLSGLRMEQTPADMLRARPEIRRAEQQVLKAAAAAGVARADLSPRIGLGGVLSVAAAVIGVHSDRGLHGTLALGPTIDMPLFDWGARQAVLQARHAELDVALLAYRQSVLEAVADVQTAMATLGLQGDRVAALERAREAVGGLESGAATRVRLGLADAFETSRVRAGIVQADLALADAELAQQLAFVALYKALGGASMDATTATTRAAPPTMASAP